REARERRHRARIQGDDASRERARPAREAGEEQRVTGGRRRAEETTRTERGERGLDRRGVRAGGKLGDEREQPKRADGAHGVSGGFAAVATDSTWAQVQLASIFIGAREPRHR